MDEWRTYIDNTHKYLLFFVNTDCMAEQILWLNLNEIQKNTYLFHNFVQCSHHRKYKCSYSHYQYKYHKHMGWIHIHWYLYIIKQSID